MSDDLFGFVDANVPKSLTPPEGYEDVHRPGNSWARQGDRLSNTSWLTPAQWNHLIAQFRGLTTIEGIDLSDVAQSSPLLLREALLRAIAAILAGEDIGSFGLMKKAVFDPQGIGGDVFDRGNHTGTQAIETIADLADLLDGIIATLVTKAPTSTLTNAGLATLSASIGDANTAPIGGFAYFSGTDAQAVAANFPSLNAGGSDAARAWSIITFGRNPGGAADRMAQIALEVFGVGTFKGRMFRREKHGTAWGAWLEIATMDRVLALAGGTVTGNLRLDGGIGIARDAPLVGGLYFHRPNGNPFIVFSGDAGATGTPVDLAQIRVEQGANQLRLVNAGLSDLVNFNLTTRLGTVAGDPTAPLGIATKQYVDASAGGLGVGQTWQDVIGSRLAQTSYQNTTGKPIMVAVKVNGGSAGSIMFRVSSDGSSWLSVGSFVTSGRQENTVIIPPGWYYRSDSNGTIERWMELR